MVSINHSATTAIEELYPPKVNADALKDEVLLIGNGSIGRGCCPSKILAFGRGDLIHGAHNRVVHNLCDFLSNSAQSRIESR